MHKRPLQQSQAFFAHGGICRFFFFFNRRESNHVRKARVVAVESFRPRKTVVLLDKPNRDRVGKALMPAHEITDIATKARRSRYQSDLKKKKEKKNQEGPEGKERWGERKTERRRCRSKNISLPLHRLRLLRRLHQTPSWNQTQLNTAPTGPHPRLIPLERGREAVCTSKGVWS